MPSADALRALRDELAAEVQGAKHLNRASTDLSTWGCVRYADALAMVVRRLDALLAIPPAEPCRRCGGSGFVAEKRSIDDGYGEVDSCPACTPAETPNEAHVEHCDDCELGPSHQDWRSVNGRPVVVLCTACLENRQRLQPLP